jgi:hypothetical protein
MGTGLEMKFEHRALTAAALCLGLLSACGNDPQAGDNLAATQNAKNLATYALTLGHPPAPAAVDGSALRAALEQAGQPVYSVKVDKMRYNGYMAPYGSNGPIQTWASTSYETVSLKDGILVATRGFGPDIMSSITPPLGQIRSASGAVHRVYYYLDGADQPQRADFDCTLAASGSETIVVLTKAYATRRVTESCSNADASFENVYWFEGSGTLRQSVQFVSVQAASMQLQRIID